MKHFRRITVARAIQDDLDVAGILDRVFAFTLELASMKGKGANTLET